MKTKTTITKENGFAQIPHGIIDAGIPDALKLLLWYCYDKPADWTFSVAEVSRSLAKTPQCIREYFRKFTAAKMFKPAGVKHNKHGKYPIYTFDPAGVDAVVKSQLTMNPETNPETDVETNPESNPESNLETNPDTGKTDTNTDVPRPNTKNDGTENNFSKESQPASKSVAPLGSTLLSDSDIQECLKTGLSLKQIRAMENEFVLRRMWGTRSKKRQVGFDSLL